MSFRTFVVALAGALAFAGAGRAANLLANTGFESGAFAPWTIASGAPVLTTAYAHGGVYSVREFAGDSIEQTFAPIATALINQVSFWVDRPNGTVLIHQVWFLYSDGSKVLNLAELPGYTGGWHEFNLAGDLAAGKFLTGIQIYGTTDLFAGNPAYIDDVFVGSGAATVPEPAAWASLILGLALAGGALRRRRIGRAIVNPRSRSAEAGAGL